MWTSSLNAAFKRWKNGTLNNNINNNNNYNASNTCYLLAFVVLIQFLLVVKFVAQLSYSSKMMAMIECCYSSSSSLSSCTTIDNNNETTSSFAFLQSSSSSNSSSSFSTIETLQRIIDTPFFMIPNNNRSSHPVVLYGDQSRLHYSLIKLLMLPQAAAELPNNKQLRIAFLSVTGTKPKVAKYFNHLLDWLILAFSPIGVNVSFVNVSISSSLTTPSLGVYTSCIEENVDLANIDWLFADVTGARYADKDGANNFVRAIWQLNPIVHTVLLNATRPRRYNDPSSTLKPNCDLIIKEATEIIGYDSKAQFTLFEWKAICNTDHHSPLRKLQRNNLLSDGKKHPPIQNGHSDFDDFLISQMRTSIANLKDRLESGELTPDEVTLQVIRSSVENKVKLLFDKRQNRPRRKAIKIDCQIHHHR